MLRLASVVEEYNNVLEEDLLDEVVHVMEAHSWDTQVQYYSLSFLTLSLIDSKKERGEKRRE